MPVGHFYSVEVFGLWDNIRFINRFTYSLNEGIAETTNTGAAQLASGINAVYEKWREIAVSTARTERIRIYGSDGIAYYEGGLVQVGMITTGDPYPYWTTYTYRGNRPSLDVRHSWKRFPGVSELVVTGAKDVTPTFSLRVAEVAMILGESVLVGAQQLYPVVVHRYVNEQELPRDQWIIREVRNWSYNGVGTQKTRKG